MFENATQVIYYFSPYWTFLFFIIGIYCFIKMEYYRYQPEPNEKKVEEYYQGFGYCLVFVWFGLLCIGNTLTYF